MTDLESVYAAVVRHPADDLPRLAYADYLEERAGPGDDARAQFVRAQVEYASLTRLGAVVLSHASRRGVCPPECVRCKRASARTLAETLFAANATTPGDPLWWQPGPALIAPWALYCHRAAFLGSRLTPAVLFRRGFPCAVRVTADQALGRRCDRCAGTGVVRSRTSEVVAGMAMNLRELQIEHVTLKCPKCNGLKRLDPAARALFAAHPLTELTRLLIRGDPEDHRPDQYVADPDLVAKFREHHGLPPA